MNAAELDEEYQELTEENLRKLHDLIRPYFLRYVYVNPRAYYGLMTDHL